MTVKGHSPAFSGRFPIFTPLSSAVPGFTEVVSDVNDPSGLVVNLNLLPAVPTALVGSVDDNLPKTPAAAWAWAACPSKSAGDIRIGSGRTGRRHTPAPCGFFSCLKALSPLSVLLPRCPGLGLVC